MIKFAVLWKLRSLAASCGTVSVKNPFSNASSVSDFTCHIKYNVANERDNNGYVEYLHSYDDQ